jgi:hypothetical protein
MVPSDPGDSSSSNRHARLELGIRRFEEGVIAPYSHFFGSCTSSQ